MNGNFGHHYGRLDKPLEETKEWLLQLDNKKRMDGNFKHNYHRLDKILEEETKEWLPQLDSKKRMDDDLCRLDNLLEETREWLLQLDSKKRLNVVREILKNPHYDESDVYILCLNEYQTQSVSVHNPPQRKTPLKIRFVMSGSKPAKPICEEENPAKKTEKTGRKRPRGSSVCESDEEEETERVVKKKKVNNNLVQGRKVVLPEIRPDLPDGLKDRIRNLEGTEVTLVIQKMLTTTDLSSRHGRLSLPRGKLIDNGFLGGKDVALIEARLVGENGKEREIDIRQWSMSKGIYNVVKGWNEVVRDHQLCQDLVVQLWSFRVEGDLWFALVKLWMVVKKQETNS